MRAIPALQRQPQGEENPASAAASEEDEEDVEVKTTHILKIRMTPSFVALCQVF